MPQGAVGHKTNRFFATTSGGGDGGKLVGISFNNYLHYCHLENSRHSSALGTHMCTANITTNLFLIIGDGEWTCIKKLFRRVIFMY